MKINFSISHKITIIIVLTTIVAMLPAGSLIIYHEYVNIRDSMVNEMSIMAQTIGTTCTAALSFNDPDAAENLLSALGAHKNIVAASIFTHNHDLFATYHRHDSKSNKIALSESGNSHRFTNEDLLISREIYLDTDYIGSITLQLNLGEMKGRIRRQVEMLALVMFGALAVVFLLSIRLQRIISEPILNLSTAAAKIGEGDLELKLDVRSDDEIGKLTLSFNQMASDLRLSQNKLLAAKDYMESIVTTMPSALVTLDEQGRIISSNPEFRKLFGPTADDGRTIGDLVPSGSLRKAIETVLIDGIEIEDLEISVADPDTDNATRIFNVSITDIKIGEIKQARFSDTPKPAESLPKVLVVFNDITERERLMSELQTKLEELKRTQAQLVQTGKLTAVGELAAGVAHEINNPLSGVLTYSILLQEKFTEAPSAVRAHFPEFSEQLEIIKEAAQRCKSIADNLLAFSRQSELELVQVGVPEIIDKTLQLIGVHIRQKGIKLTLDIGDDLPLIYANSNRLQQVYTNIIINAIQALNIGGELVIKVTAKDNICETIIRDNGPGIPPENLDKIFEPFFTTKPVGQGTGLGLSIVYGIVRDHGGTISVNSKIGEGTEFHIALPSVVSD